IDIRSENGKNGSSTDIEGRFVIAVNDGSAQLIFSGRGYVTRRVEIGAGGALNVQLQTDVHHKDDIVHLGYSSQRREEVSGSVATVTGEALERSPVANLSQTFAGRFPGL